MHAAPGDLRADEREAWLRGRQCFERGDDEAALAELSRLAQTRGRFADLQYMLGLVLERRGEIEAAAQHLEEALRINPDYVEALLALATLCERRGDFERGRALAERAAVLARASVEGGLDPVTRGKLANLQAALGDAYREAGELRDAIEAYRKALDRCPDFHDIRCRLAVSLRESGHPHQSLQELRRVLRVNPGYLAAAVQMGVTLLSLGRAPDAIRVWQAVLAKDPAREDARWYLSSLRGAGNAEPGTPPPGR